MAVTTLKGHVSRALSFYDKNDIYIGIGKKSKWDDDNHPPKPQNTDEIQELIKVKKVDSKFLVKPDNSGKISYGNKRWSPVSREKALEEGARWVYISVSLDFTEVPIDIVYRQIGCYTSLIKQKDVDDSKSILDPEEVEDLGILEILDNRKPVYRETDKRELIGTIIEF